MRKKFAVAAVGLMLASCATTNEPSPVSSGWIPANDAFKKEVNPAVVVIAPPVNIPGTGVLISFCDLSGQAWILNQTKQMVKKSEASCPPGALEKLRAAVRRRSV